MASVSLHILFAFGDLWRLDILIWMAGVPVIVLAVLILYMQYRRFRQLNAEVEQLAKIQRHSIEYDLVLKAMKLSIWRIDVPTRTVTFESDYREAADSFLPAPSTSLEEFFNLLLPAYQPKLRQTVSDLMTGRIEDGHEQYEMRIPHSDRSYWGESFATVEKRDINGNPLQIVGTTARIDRQKDIEQALIRARNQAEESDRLKTAFLANMSHEVRTPLNAIVGFSEVLPMAESDEERQNLIALIKKNNAQLLHLFDDMVNMSKLEAGGQEAVHKTRFPLLPLLQETVDRYTQMSQDTGVPLVIETQDNVPSPNTDRKRLGEILNQYVDNALKFTSKGRVTLGWQTTDNTLRVWVRDTGKGIPEDRCDDRLFERFVKIDEFVPGTGLGLSICRSMALSLGGKVGVESVIDQGSLFWVEIPMDS